MKPIITCYIILIAAFTACQPNLQSQTDRAIATAKLKFSNLAIESPPDYELVRKLEIRHPEATIQLLQPTRQSDGDGQIIVLSNTQNQFYAVPLPLTRYKGYWNFVYDTTSPDNTLKTKTFETELNKALDTLGLNRGYDGSNVINELFTSVLQARQLSGLDTPTLKPVNIQPHVYPDSCIEMGRKTYQRLVSPMRKDKYWFSHLYRDNSDRIFLVDSVYTVKGKKKYYHFNIYRQPCVIEVKLLNL
ncbi:hypothetical protein [Mucilaginibacter sp. OK283]|uniref:hypothetical protein n=1 Tax=Mucilaginibacter sp. OK283 TaxID=1881049 RepID=UPI0008D51165|nr:hypothetical protein [Mucilaginibacter sp. OK283]SEO47572.1 hypothetical protein SAMN05428947_102497 [Mucilaginibacter sp. OK283]